MKFCNLNLLVFLSFVLPTLAFGAEISYQTNREKALELFITAAQSSRDYILCSFLRDQNRNLDEMFYKRQRFKIDIIKAWYVHDFRKFKELVIAHDGKVSQDTIGSALKLFEDLDIKITVIELKDLPIYVIPQNFLGKKESEIPVINKLSKKLEDGTVKLTDGYDNLGSFKYEDLWKSSTDKSTCRMGSDNESSVYRTVIQYDGNEYLIIVRPIPLVSMGSIRTDVFIFSKDLVFLRSSHFSSSPRTIPYAVVEVTHKRGNAIIKDLALIVTQQDAKMKDGSIFDNNMRVIPLRGDDGENLTDTPVLESPNPEYKIKSIEKNFSISQDGVIKVK